MLSIQKKTRSSKPSSSDIFKSRRFSKLSLAIFIFIFAGIGSHFLLSSQAAGSTANIWISSTGSDTGASCTRSATPIADPGSGECASFQKAYSLAACGDIVGVKGGSYSSQTISSGTKSCSSSTQVLFTSVPGASCTDNTTVTMNSISISVAYVKVQCMNANPSGDTTCSSISGSSGQHTSIIWNSLDHMALHCGWFDSDNMSVTNSTFGPDNTCQTGQEDLTDFRANSDNIKNVTFNNDTFETVTAPPDFECGIGEHVDSMQGYGMSNLTIENSNFYGCPGQCIIFRPYSGGIPGPITFENDFFNQAQSPGQAIDLGSSTSSDGDACNPGTILIENNTFENGAALHGGFWSGGCSVIFRNNIMTNSSCGFGGSYATYSYNVFYSGATCGTNAKACTPSYVGATTSLTSPGNFSLTPTDTCAQNAGDPSNYPPTDFYGTTRPQGTGVDVGAMEVVSGSGGGSGPTIGDLNSDGHVNITDLSILLSHYGQSATPSQGDCNSDGIVNISDLSILLSHYGT